MTADEAVAAVVEALEFRRPLHDRRVPRLELPRDPRGHPRRRLRHRARSRRALTRERGALARPLSLDQQGAFEAVTATLRFIVRLEGSPFVCEMFVRSDDPHDVERFRRRLRVRALDRAVWVATAEDMVVTKLRWARDAERAKDREDVRNMLAVRGDALDWEIRQTASHLLLEPPARSRP